jgi:carbon monoxide dehydrogenase subunit G
MRLSGKFDAQVPEERAWGFLLDLNQFAACIPGLESIHQLDDSTFDGVIGAKVGPMGGRFAFRATITERHPTDRLVVSVDGDESTTGSRMTATITLALAALDGGTRVSYQADVVLGGKLAIIGEMVLRATAGVLLGEFAQRMRRRLEAAAGDGAEVRGGQT